MHMTATVSDVLREKGNEVVTIPEATSSLEALKKMQDKMVNSLVVVNGEGKVVGIVSEGDYVKKIILQDKSVKDTPVSQIMTKHLLSVSPEKTVDECISIMLKERVRHLPVFRQEKLVGIISIGDTVKSIVKGQRIEIKHLSNYIAGNYA